MKAKIINEHIYPNIFLMGARVGELLISWLSPGSTLFQKWSLCSVGSKETAALAWRNCCTLPWLEAVVKCCNNTSAHTKLKLS